MKWDHELVVPEGLLDKITVLREVDDLAVEVLTSFAEWTKPSEVLLARPGRGLGLCLRLILQLSLAMGKSTLYAI